MKNRGKTDDMIYELLIAILYPLDRVLGLVYDYFTIKSKQMTQNRIRVGLFVLTRLWTRPQ